MKLDPPLKTQFESEDPDDPERFSNLEKPELHSTIPKRSLISASENLSLKPSLEKYQTLASTQTKLFCFRSTEDSASNSSSESISATVGVWARSEATTSTELVSLKGGFGF
ncbi:hypothetical protein [Candidatus Mycoplasma haematohominis]|uniref:Uncharacterized protein n=1 Tax=Candidatus Mycoplasma haematohominis TaxID=1494318 RepID=A0A478FPZ6_9MOLU|nr:hypothetical protein [Candidatus Mycoplasma haemohominis]GCE63137.1 hypothetical protein MHSWG343_01150 [Candidatus Mycoplasma haemohominis]